MSRKIFVGGIAFSVTTEELHAAFDKFGDIEEAKVITDRETGRSRGFGFVTFNDPDSARKAIAEMNGTEMAGRTIRVDEASGRR